MDQERRSNLRQKIMEAYSNGAQPSLHASYMPVTFGELIELLDTADRYDARTSELLHNCNRHEQTVRDYKRRMAGWRKAMASLLLSSE